MRVPLSSFAPIIRSTLNERRAVVVTSMHSLTMRVAGLVSTFAMGVILARVLGPAEFGRYGLVTTLAGIAMSIGLLGTPQLAVREFSIRKAREDWAGIRQLGKSFGFATTLASVGLALLALTVTIAIDPSGYTVVGFAIPGCLLMLFTVTTALTASELRGLGLMSKGQIMDILVRPLFACLVLLGLVVSGLHFGAKGALWVQTGVAAVAALASIVWVRSATPIASDSAGVDFRWLAAALPLGVVDILRQLDGGYGVIMMGWLTSDEALGLFRVAIACNAVVGMPATILHVVLAPNVARLHNEGRTDELQQLLSWASAALTAILGLMTLAIAVAGRPVLQLVFGPVYGGSWLPLVVMTFAQLVFGIFGMGPILLAMCDAERHLIKIYLAAVGLGIASAVPMILVYGANGAAAAMIVSMGMIGLLSWRYGRSSLGVDCTFLPLLRSTQTS